MISFLANAFNIVLYKPLFNFLVLIYNYFPGHDFGIAIIILTLVIRLLLYPSSTKSIKTQKALNELQPQLQEIQKKYKDDKEKQMKETLALYKQSKVNPFGGLLPTIIQLPLLIALFMVFQRGLNPAELVNLYNFVPNPNQINTVFLGVIDLAKPSWILAIAAGISQFVQTKTFLPINKKKNTDKGSDFMKTMQKQMVYFFPFITVIILLSLPSALGLYWTVGGLFLIAEQRLIFRKQKAC